VPVNARHAIAAYLLARASDERSPPRPLADHLHARALEELAALVLGLPDGDERLLTLGTLAVRDGAFVPGPATRRALARLQAGPASTYEAFLTRLVRVALEDALQRAREHGLLPR
jgi:hypothetical protein